ncbi:hypothetical protein BOTNAR_2004g00010 [Botryotinia narcissicola]|uniref:Uncharacterized protein n=1 Tax=Botryotinia narcissicola TaxID=278944 RepID=A0A4Z1H654_9HELO|nr:hypothetical protein BOTNAR_2004g00010 [Botryotinia narcissicola]
MTISFFILSVESVRLSTEKCGRKSIDLSAFRINSSWNANLIRACSNASSLGGNPESLRIVIIRIVC